MTKRANSQMARGRNINVVRTLKSGLRLTRSITASAPLPLDMRGINGKLIARVDTQGLYGWSSRERSEVFVSWEQYFAWHREQIHAIRNQALQDLVDVLKTCNCDECQQTLTRLFGV